MRILLYRYIPFGRTRLGIAYSHKSAFTALFQGVENGTVPWYEALNVTKYPEMRIGRTDPNTDPKGARTG